MSSKRKQTHDARRSRNNAANGSEVDAILGKMASGKASETKAAAGSGSPAASPRSADGSTAPDGELQLPPGLPPVIDVNVIVTKDTPRGRSDQLINFQPNPKEKPMLLPVSYSVKADAKEGETLRLRARVLGPPQEIPPPPPSSRLGGVEEEVWELRDQFRMRRLPWWVVFILAVYALLKFHAVFSSPCAVLGVQSPATERQIKKAYRTLATCTHPDKLVGRDLADQKRAEVLFKRVSEAQDDIKNWMKDGGRRRDRCFENPHCAEVKAQFKDKLFAKKCDKPQRATFRDGSKTEPLSALCPCSCMDVQTPDGPLEEVSCYQDEIEVQVYNFLQDIPVMLGQTSGQDIWYFFDYLKQYFLDIVTLQHGPMGSISMLFTLSMIWRMLLRPFLQFFYKGTVFQSIVSVPTALIFAPLPTLFRLVASPIVRWIVFVQKELLPFLRKTGASEELAEDDSEVADRGEHGADSPGNKQLQPKKKEKVERDLDKMKAAAAAGSDGGHWLRKRKAKKVSKADVEAEKERVLLGKGVGGTTLGANEEAAEEEAVAEDTVEGAEGGGTKEGVLSAAQQMTVANKKTLRELIEKRPPRLSADEEQRLAMNTGRLLPRSKAQWRQIGSSTIKFEFVLTLTKNILPLLMMIVMGQVFNGLVVSMVLGYIIRNYIPEMRIETLHFWLVLAGFFHTFFGQRGARQAEESSDIDQVITLEWEWGFRDTLYIIAQHHILAAADALPVPLNSALGNVVQLGATFAAASQLGNEPGFVTSFAAGIALRYQTYALTGAMLSSLPGVQTLSDLMPASIQIRSLDEVAAQSGGGIGDCGGGPFIMLFGREYAVVASFCLRLALLILPVLHFVMWCTRFLRDFGKIANPKYRGLVMTRGVLAVVCGCQVAFLMFHNFNGVQGSLAGFWIAGLTAAIWESLVATYDLRGQGRQLLYLIIFLFI